MSMLAEDLQPNRLTRARFRLSDLLLETTEGQVGWWPMPVMPTW